MMSKRFLALLLFGIGWNGVTAGDSHGALVTIGGFTYDLDQFSDATVTTDAFNDADNPNGPMDEIVGSTFDNLNGIDGFTLGELATAQFGVDPGDRITLGFTPMEKNFLTLDYGLAPVSLIPGSFFVVLEQATDIFDPDAEATSFEISFNGDPFKSAALFGSTTMNLLGAGGDPQNQIVFDLFTDFGFSVGDMLQSVTIQNLGVAGEQDDPDFLFAGVAVPEPNSLAILGIGAIGLTIYRRRKKGIVATASAA